MVRSRSSSKVHPETNPTSDEAIVSSSNSSFCNVREITCLVSGNFGNNKISQFNELILRDVYHWDSV